MKDPNKKTMWRNEVQGSAWKESFIHKCHFEYQTFFVGTFNKFRMGRFMRPGGTFAACPAGAHGKHRLTSRYLGLHLKPQQTSSWIVVKMDLYGEIAGLRVMLPRRWRKGCLGSGVTYWSECGCGTTQIPGRATFEVSFISHMFVYMVRIYAVSYTYVIIQMARAYSHLSFHLPLWHIEQSMPLLLFRLAELF